MENNPTSNDATTLSKWRLLRLRILRWWLFTFCNKTLWKGEINGFRYRFRKFWLDIESIAPNHWNLRIGTSNYAYGFLLDTLSEMKRAEADGLTEEVAALKHYFAYFASTLYLTSVFLLQDVKFVKGINKELEWASKRIMRKAEEEASKVTKEQNDADEALMQSVVDEANMTRQQRRKAQREQRKQMRKVATKIAEELSAADSAEPSETETAKHSEANNENNI